MRKVKSFVGGFCDYMAEDPAPKLFQTWGALFCLAAVLQRKVWLRSYNMVTYPNLYVLLIAPPGVGKTVVTSKVHKFLGQIEGVHLASPSLTAASVVDELADSTTVFIPKDRGKETLEYNALTIVVNEFGVFLPAYDSSFLNKLTDIYDGHPYSERRRTKDLHKIIEKPQINLLSGGTPSYLNSTMPPMVWEQGFMSRVMIAFSGQRIVKPLFTAIGYDNKLEAALLSTLEHINNLSGEISFTKEAAELINTWHINGGPPAPTHPRLLHYKQRRTIHLLSLCMVAAADTDDKLMITVDHYIRALGWLLELEAEMPNVFAAMTSGGDGAILKECHFYIYNKSIAVEDGYVDETVLVEFLQERVPAYNIVNMITAMEKAGWVKRKATTSGAKYKPQKLKVNADV